MVYDFINGLFWGGGGLCLTAGLSPVENTCFPWSSSFPHRGHALSARTRHLAAITAHSPVAAARFSSKGLPKVNLKASNWAVSFMPVHLRLWLFILHINSS